MLLQQCAASPLLLSSVSRKGARVQGEKQKERQRNTADLFGRPVRQHCNAKEEDGHDRTEKVYHSIAQGERSVRQLSATRCTRISQLLAQHNRWLVVGRTKHVGQLSFLLTDHDDRTTSQRQRSLVISWFDRGWRRTWIGLDRSYDRQWTERRIDVDTQDVGTRNISGHIDKWNAMFELRIFVVQRRGLPRPVCRCRTEHVNHTLSRRIQQHRNTEFWTQVLLRKLLLETGGAKANGD